MKKNILYNLAYQILAIILPFITAPYLSRVIGAEGVGVYSFSYSIALYFTYFTLLGLTNYGNRVIAGVQDNLEERSKAFCEIYCMQIICFTISIILYTIYTFTFSSDKTASLIMILTVISALFDINWFFFGMEKFKLTVIRNTIIKVATVLSIFLFVRSKDDIYIYIAIMSLGTLLSQLCLWPFLKQMIKFRWPGLKNIFKHFKPNLTLFIPVIAVSIYNIMDKVFLGYASTMEQVGYYENAGRIISLTVTMITAVGTVMLPRMSSLVASNRISETTQYIDKTMLVVLAYVNAVTFGIISIARDFSSIYYGPDFILTGDIMIYLAVTVIFLGCGNVIRTQYLIPNKKDSVYVNSAIIGAIVNLIINILLIQKLGAVGASIGTICAELAVCAYQMFHVRTVLKLRKYIWWQFVFMTIGIIMNIVIKTIPTSSNDYLALAEQIIIGGIVYIFLSGIYMIKIEGIKISKFNKIEL